MHVFIPMHYTGWVNILYNQETASNQPLLFDNGYVFMITGNPAEFKVSASIYPEGWYENHYYYYAKDTLLEIKLEHILFKQVGQTNMHTKDGKPLYATSFYIAKEGETESNLRVPINPVIK